MEQPGSRKCAPIGIVAQARFYNPDGWITSADTAAVSVTLKPSEIQVISPQ